MLKFENLSLENKGKFNSFMKGRGYRHSEASFANLFMWQEVWDIQVAFDDYALYIKMDSEIYKPFLLPPYLYNFDYPIKPGLEKIDEYMEEYHTGFDVKCVIPRYMEKIQKECPGEYVFSLDEPNGEYMYNTHDLATLEGKKYHSKRNRINKLLKDHDFEYIKYTHDMKGICLDIHERWIEEKNIEGEEDATEEYETTLKALNNFEKLDLEGCIIKIDGEPCAFSLGERLCDDTALILVEKAVKYDGLYQFINREFVVNQWNDTKFINREEDMGIEGLRKAKQSYYPAYMLERYDMVKANGNTKAL